MLNTKKYLKHNGLLPKALFGDGHHLKFTSHLWLIGLIIVFASIGAYLLITSHAATTLSADFNNDGVVNIPDLSILATNWGKTGQTKATGDANGDGSVNILDLSLLASQWGQSTTVTPPANSINVKDYGATGNGTTDDTKAINKAFAAALAAGKTAYIPAGTYIVYSPFTFPANITISGDGFSSWLKGQILFNTGDNISNLALGVDAEAGINGVDSYAASADVTLDNPVNNLQVTNVDFKLGPAHGGRLGRRRCLHGTWHPN